MQLTFRQIRYRCHGQPLRVSFTWWDAGYVIEAVNMGLDAELESCFVASRGDYYGWRSTDGALEAEISPQSLCILARRLHDGGVQARLLAEELLGKIGIRVGREVDWEIVRERQAERVLAEQN